MNTPIDKDSDSPMEQRSRELFDETVANLDARTRSRLNQARHAALDAARGQPVASPVRWLLPVGSAAAVAMVALTTVQIMRPGAEAPVVVESATLASVDDFEILTSSDELEMLQDVDFYAWLETQDSEAGATSEAG